VIRSAVMGGFRVADGAEPARGCAWRVARRCLGAVDMP
jgi:hypothetical protein